MKLGLKKGKAFAHSGGFSTKDSAVGRACSLSIAFHTYSHKHFLQFAVLTDHISVSSIPSSPCLCTVRVRAYYIYCCFSRNVSFCFIFFSLSTHRYQALHELLSNCAIVQERKVNIKNGSQLEGKIMVMRF